MPFQPDLFASVPTPPAPKKTLASVKAAAEPVRAGAAPTLRKPAAAQSAATPVTYAEEGITEESRANLEALLKKLDRSECRAQRIISSYPISEQVDILVGRLPRPAEFQQAIEEDWADPAVPARLRHSVMPPEWTHQ